MHRHRSCDLNLNSDPCRHVRCYNSLAPFDDPEGDLGKPKPCSWRGWADLISILLSKMKVIIRAERPSPFVLFTHFFLILSSPRLPLLFSPPLSAWPPSAIQSLIIIARNLPLSSLSSISQQIYTLLPSSSSLSPSSPLSPPPKSMKRRHSDQDVQSRSDASSNGFDTESDVGHSGASSAQNTRRVREKMLNHSVSPPHPPPPVKKKRTRTLTTPQQSAALHALLAQVSTPIPHLRTNPVNHFHPFQSRFPTTAMREQVGRSIGLSARKVQVRF